MGVSLNGGTPKKKSVGKPIPEDLGACIFEVICWCHCFWGQTPTTMIFDIICGELFNGKLCHYSDHVRMHLLGSVHSLSSPSIPVFLLPPKPEFPRLRCRDQVIIYTIFRLGDSILQYHVFYDPVPGTQQDTRRSQRQMILYSIKLPACTLQASFFMIPTQSSSL